MAERFEDLKVWQKSRDLTRTIYELSGKKTFSNDWPLSNQIRKAAISITSNIAEGFEREGRSEFIQFLSIAKGSTGEVRSQLYISLDQKYISDSEFRQAYNLPLEVSAMIRGLIGYLQNSNLKGSKYKRKDP